MASPPAPAPLKSSMGRGGPKRQRARRRAQAWTRQEGRWGLTQSHGAKGLHSTLRHAKGWSATVTVMPTGNGTTFTFLPCAMATSGRIHGEFLRLLYILAHRRAQVVLCQHRNCENSGRSQSYQQHVHLTCYRPTKAREGVTRIPHKKGSVCWEGETEGLRFEMESAQVTFMDLDCFLLRDI